MGQAYFAVLKNNWFSTRHAGVYAKGHEKEKNEFIKFDVVADVRETGEMAMENESTGVVYIGGGTPKNFIQQTEVTAPMINKIKRGHVFCLNFICLINV